MGAGGPRPPAPGPRQGFPPLAPEVAAELARRHRRRLWTMGAVGTGGVAAAVGAVLLLTSASPGTLQVTGVVVSPGPPSTAATVASAPRPTAPVTGLVPLALTTRAGTVEECGVAVTDDLVAAPYDPLRTATAVAATGASGPTAATVVAADPASDVALLRLADPAVPAHFAGPAEVAAGTGARVVAWSPGDPEAAPDTAAAVVRSSGTAAAPAAPGLAAIVVSAPRAPDVPGAVLATPGGAVLGVMAGQLGPGLDVFLPGSLVRGVAAQLASGDTVRHGWLDVEITGPTGGGRGVTVSSVDPDGAAAGALRVGDVIDRLEGVPVESVAGLRTQLYVLRPGTPVVLTVRRGGRTLTVDVTLARASAGSSTPA